jgi:hypothetical protein
MIPQLCYCGLTLDQPLRTEMLFMVEEYRRESIQEDGVLRPKKLTVLTEVCRTSLQACWIVPLCTAAVSYRIPSNPYAILL